ncbi:MAG: S26 family signal peptidase [Gemmataceae bacterium]|nr:S26 family signal peptidase [Gemmataceae bacterium]
MKGSPFSRGPADPAACAGPADLTQSRAVLRTAAKRPAAPSAPRRAVEILVLAVCLVLILRQWGLEPYEVPTGSMAPALAGHHRQRDCPRCAHPVIVGEQQRDSGKSFCPNCGLAELDMREAPQVRGDRLIVSRSVFAFRRPRRWEIVVFRLLGVVFVKRVVGLPGEWLAIHDGDIVVNDQLARKTLDELRSMRVLVFDSAYSPGPGGWRQRWETLTPGPAAQLDGTALRLDGTASATQYQLTAYRHFQLDSRQSEPITDEYSYNGGERGVPSPVHDFLAEFRLEVSGSQGWVLLGVTDGQDHLVAEIPIHNPGTEPTEARLSGASSWPPSPNPAVVGQRVHSTARDVHLTPNQNHRVELAFADRRLTLRVDGKQVFTPLDLPQTRGRPGVVRPVVLGVRGTQATVRNFRLFRDIHYTNDGSKGTGKAVHLGEDQYFVLGDNSRNSRDSRVWGTIPGHNLIGKPFIILPPGR